MAELMPMTSPRTLTSGPPEFPGLIAASVWMKSWMLPWPARGSPARARPLALTMPEVTVKVSASPRGLPMASTNSPTRASSLLPRAIGGRLVASILTTATSVLGSAPTTFALNSRRSSRRTVTCSAPSTTWLLVRM
jgi:hypothetical protein